MDLQVDEKNQVFIERENAKLFVANPNEHAFQDQLFYFQFGAYACTHVLVFADSFEDALEEAAEWLRAHAPGVFHERSAEDLADARKELAEERGVKPEDLDDAEVEEFATQDLTYTESGYLASWEWFVRDADEKLKNDLVECLKADRYGVDHDSDSHLER